MNSFKISFIIPVYNSKEFLRHCVDSIIFQEYKNIEIILVDDGSSDGSGLICDEYSNNFSFVKTIHKNNEGVATARNVGLKECVGDYIFFVDNDDWIESGTLTGLVRDILKSGADLVINKYYIIDGYTKSLGNGFINSKFVNNKTPDEVLRYFRKKRINIMAPWEYVVRREIILDNNIIFNPSQNGLDDSVFSAVLFCTCKSFLLGKNPIYYWRQTDNSQGRNHRKEDFIKKVFATVEDLLFFAENSDQEEKIKYIYFCIYKNIFSLLQFFSSYSVEEEHEIKSFMKLNKKAIKRAVKCSGILHFVLFGLFGSFYGLLISYKVAKIKGCFYKKMYRLKSNI